jgi:hypothetical protein
LINKLLGNVFDEFFHVTSKSTMKPVESLREQLVLPANPGNSFNRQLRNGRP